MEQEVERLARAAVEYREAGHSLLQAVDLLVDEHPDLRDRPFCLILVLRAAFGLSVADLKAIASWVQGDVPRELLEEWLQESR